MAWVCALAAALCGVVRAAETPSKEHVEFFETRIRPLLIDNCYKCHADGKAKGNLTLTTRGAILKGGDLGPAISLEKPDESNLLTAIQYRNGLEMPPTGKLRPDQIETLTKWVKAGLPMKDTAAATAKADTISPSP